MWFVANKLSLSIDKTCYSVFGSRNHSYSVDSVINLNDNVLTEVDKCKYLGLMIDNNLTWRPHIDYVYSKLMKFIGIFL